MVRTPRGFLAASLCAVALTLCTSALAKEPPETVALGKSIYRADDVRVLLGLVTDIQARVDLKINPKLADPTPQPNLLFRPITPDFGFIDEPPGLDPRPMCDLYDESWGAGSAGADCGCKVYHACAALHLSEYESIVQAVFAANRAASGRECTSACL